MGLTQHAHGVDTIKALVNVGLARGLVGRPNRGLVPIRGHSGVQGGAEVGCAPKVDGVTAARWTKVWGFQVPDAAGWTASEMIEHAARGEVDLFWMLGGNFLETLADVERSREALRRPRLRVHQDIVFSSSMLVDGGDVLLLPAATRYESPGGGTETSTERRIIFSPEIPGRRIGSAKPEWWVFREVMARARPELRHLVGLDDASRHPSGDCSRGASLQGHRDAAREGRSGAVGWAHALHQRPFCDAGRQGALLAGVGTGPIRPDGADMFTVSTRRGKQFNSMVQRPVDPLTGAGRDDIFISAEDVARLGLAAGAAVRLRSACGTFSGRLKVAPIKPGNLEVHWPEGTTILSSAAIDPASMEPDYNAVVTLEAAGDLGRASASALAPRGCLRRDRLRVDAILRMRARMMSAGGSHVSSCRRRS